MTMPELVLATDDDVEKTRVPGGGVPMSPEEIREYRDKYRALTPRERMELIKQGLL